MSSEDSNLTLEKLAINTRLEKVELILNTLVVEGRLKTESDKVIIKAIQENVESLTHIINGNGKIGLAEKVRKIEDVVAQVKWLWISIIAFSANFVKDWILKS